MSSRSPLLMHHIANVLVVTAKYYVASRVEPTGLMYSSPFCECTSISSEREKCPLEPDCRDR